MHSKPYIWSPWSTARVDPDRLAVVAEDSCTFSELVDRADRLGDGLHALDLPDGALISTDIPASPRFFALALAALRYGYGLFSVDREFGEATSRVLLADARPVVHITSEEKARAGAVLDETVIRASSPAYTRTYRDDRRRGGYLVFATSGTTGVPKVVVRARPPYPYKGVAVFARYFAGATLGPHVMANPAFHFGTLSPALYALQAGSAVVVQESWSPALLAELVDKYAADSAFVSPYMLSDVVAHGDWPRRGPRIVFHGGTSCAPELKRAAIDLMGPILHESYGTSECLISEISAGEWLRYPGSVGRPLPGVGVDIQVDGVTQAAGEVGEICVHPRAIDRRPGGDETIHTGDVGFLGPAGHLFIVGRAASPHELRIAFLERAVRSLSAVADVAVIGEPVFTCYAESTAYQSPELRRQIERIAEDLAVGLVHVDLRPTGSLPRTASGKIWRAALVAARHSGGN